LPGLLGFVCGWDLNLTGLSYLEVSSIGAWLLRFSAAFEVKLICLRFVFGFWVAAYR